jgi:hypothetical protein
VIAPARPARGQLPCNGHLSQAGGGWSEVHTLPPFPRDKFRFCHFGDQAVRDSSRRVMDSVRQQNPDFFLVAGDLSYANGDQMATNQSGTAISTCWSPIPPGCP